MPDPLWSFFHNKEYGSLGIETDAGEVEIPSGFLFRDVCITGDATDISCASSASGSIEIYADEGDILLDDASAGGDVVIDEDVADVRLSGASVGGSVSLSLDSGTISLTDVGCGGLSASIDEGNVLLDGVIAKAALSIEDDACDVRLDGCDAETIDIRVGAGDIAGTLLSGKDFRAESQADSIDIPKSSPGGTCKLSTDAGDIRMGIAGE